MDLSITTLIILESNLRLRDAISTVEGLLDRAVELNYKMIAITEHDSLSSHIRAQKYYNKLKEKNPDLDLKLILGNEIYLVRNGLSASNYDSTQDRYFHFVLVALDEIGHTQLQELSTRAWGRSYVSRGHRRVPTYYQDLFDIVQKNPGHLVATSSCLGGIVGTQLLRWQESGKVPSHYEQIVKWVNQMNNLFGQGYFFLEMQPSHNEEQIFVNKEIIKISHQTGVPTIINLDAHYLRKEDRLIHKAFLTSQPGPREVDAFYATTYLMDTDEILDYMKTHLSEEEIHKAFEGSARVYSLVEEYDLRKPLHIPYLVSGLKDPNVDQVNKWKKEIPLVEDFYKSEHPSDRHLITQILKRLETDDTLQNKETYDEVSKNLESIKLSSEVMNTPWSAYLLNVQETVNTIWNVDAIVGCARGSVTGFLLAYILGITQINPLREKTKTYAFRFLNPQRVSPLDIDLDSPASKRQVIYKALEDKYGKDRIARVATFKTEKAKSAILTAARGLGIGVEEASYLSTLVTSERGFTRSLSQMYHGDVEAGIPANKEFKRVMDNEYPELWKVATYIENLISGMSSHASGVIITDEPIYLSTALMRTNGGDIVTQYDLHDCEEVSLIKQDLLTVEALDRIQTTLELLIEQNYITQEATWRETYEKVIGIYNIERNDPKMWERLWNHEVQSFFQMEQQSGVQAISLAKPHSVDDLAVLNSALRLIAQEKGGETPLEKFARFKNDINEWEREMDKYRLVEEEKEVLRKHLSVSSGLCITQEQFMMLVQEPLLGGHDLLWADRLRKAVGKKKIEEFEQCEVEFYQTIKDKNLSYNFCDYVWRVLISMNKGYGFNASHTLSYSLIGLQELNLAHRFPIVFWNTACLIVDSGSLVVEEIEPDEEEESIVYDQSPEVFYEEVEEDDDEDDGSIKKEKAKIRKIDYGKLSSAISRFQAQGITILPPDVNKSKFTFNPDVENNAIHYGLSGITRVSEDLIRTIMENRPYASLKDFLERVKVNKLQAVNLIKAGLFDSLQPRREAMFDYLKSVSDIKKRITLQNMRMLIEKNILPLEYDLERRIFNFNRYLKTFKKDLYYVLNDTAVAFIREVYDIDKCEIIQGVPHIKISLWEAFYKKSMNPVRAWMKANQQEVLNTLNNSLIQDMVDKYAKGPISKWEMDAISHYQSEHELDSILPDFRNFKSFNDLNESPGVINRFQKDGKTVEIFNIERIAGTVLDRDKTKNLVVLLTRDGIAQVKIFGNIFAAYDRRIAEYNEQTGKKEIKENSWFTRGTKLVISGIRRGDTFIAKKYARTPWKLIEKIVSINDDGTFDTVTERYGESA